MTTRQQRDRNRVAGFTLVEALVATALMAMILTALATIAGQWMPNWNRGVTRVQGDEELALGLERLVADLGAAQFITAGRADVEAILQWHQRIPDICAHCAFAKCAPRARNCAFCRSRRRQWAGPGQNAGAVRTRCRRRPRSCTAALWRSGRARAGTLPHFLFVCWGRSRLARRLATGNPASQSRQSDGTRREDASGAGRLDRDFIACRNPCRLYQRKVIRRLSCVTLFAHCDQPTVGKPVTDPGQIQ